MEIHNSLRIKMVGKEKEESFVWVHTDRSSISPRLIKEAAAAAKQAHQSEVFLRHKRGKTEYSIDKSCWVKVDVKKAKGIDATIMRTTKLFMEVKETQIQRLKNYLLKQKDKNCLLQFVCSFLLQPVIWLNGYFSPAWMDELKTLSENEAPYSAKALEDALLEARAILREGEQEAKDCIDKGLDFAARLKKGEPLDHIVDGLVKQIIERYHDKNEILALIPTGFWRQGETYEPVMIALTRGDAGSLILREFGYGEDDQKRVQDFKMETLNAENLKSALLGLYIAAMPPQKMEGMMDKYLPALACLNLSPEVLSAKVATKTLEPSSKDPHLKFRELLLVSSGFEKGEPLIERRLKVRTNPMKLVHEALRVNFPEVPMKDKLEFTKRLLQRRIKRFLKHTRELNGEQKERFLLKLEKMHKALVHRRT